LVTRLYSGAGTGVTVAVAVGAGVSVADKLGVIAVEETKVLLGVNLASAVGSDSVGIVAQEINKKESTMMGSSNRFIAKSPSQQTGSISKS